MRTRAVVTALTATLALAAAAAAPASAATFPYIAPTAVAPTPFSVTTVPAGMRFAFVDMFGAQGTGKGAHVIAGVPVTPGETLRVYVGGAPDSANPLIAAGYNGGGAPATPASSGGGGGASDIRRDASPASRIVVAGGGGGDGDAGTGGASAANGGDGGTLSVDGEGGTSGNAGGGGGSGGGAIALPAASGADASGATGGAAGAGTVGRDGGGGGGGYVGGGGGGAGGFSVSGISVTMGGGGGGGGGSSLAPGGTVENGVRSGNGAVTIAYSATDPRLPAGGGLTPSTITPRDTVKPRLGSFGFSRSTFAAARSGASTSARKKRRKRTPVGTKVTYRLSEAATVKFSVQRKAAGRKRGRKCVKPKRSNRKKRRCTRWLTVRGSFSVTGKAGRNSFTFRGRMGGKKLKPGSYRLNGTARDPARNRSAVRRKRFRIVKS